MYENAQRMRFEELRSIAFGDISGVYAQVGTQLANPARIIKMINSTDVDITVSFDGVTDHDILTTNATGFVYDIGTNKSLSAPFFLDIGSSIYVKGTPTSGSVYVVVIYASSN